MSKWLSSCGRVGFGKKFLKTDTVTRKLSSKVPSDIGWFYVLRWGFIPALALRVFIWIFYSRDGGFMTT